MAPNASCVPTGVLAPEDDVILDPKMKHTLPYDKDFKYRFKWNYVIYFVLLHLGALYGAYLMFTSAIKWPTLVFGFVLYYVGKIGMTAGSHRLFSHRAYKASAPLKVLLVIFNSIAGEFDCISWAKIHRLHHKYTETDSDPHNQSRGFWYAHMGWALLLKHPDVKKKAETVDISDLTSDPILMFQKRNVLIMEATLCLILPTVIPMYFWGETFNNAWYVGTLLRYCVSLHTSSLINSAAHMWGTRPYDRTIAPTENLLVDIGTMGEGGHNFHHTFPWDYRQAELDADKINCTTAFIDFCSRLGLAWDLKTVSPAMVQKRVERTGDGSHALWGWGDKDMLNEDRAMTVILKEKCS